MTGAVDEPALLAVVAGLVPATAQQVGAALGKLAQRLGELTEQLAVADERSTRLTEEHALAYDRAFLSAGEGEVRVTEAVRAATARVETHEHRLAMELAKLDVRNLRNAHRTLDRRIDVGRTMASTIRSEMRSIGYGSGS